MKISTVTTDKKGDLYWFRDDQELKTKTDTPLFLTHNLCTNCLDYYDVPPCQNSLQGDSGCFPSLVTSDHN